jgi:hypothetical protein
MKSYFKGWIGCNLEVYVDDIIVKTLQSCCLIADLEESFANLRHFDIKLNPEKCTFGVPRGKLLGYIITKRGIEANPDNVSAIAKISRVRNVNNVKCLMWCLASLSHFVSRQGNTGSHCTSYWRSLILSAV